MVDDKRAADLNEWLREWRLSSKDTPDYFTQPEISKELTDQHGEGWSQSLLSKIEGGRRTLTDWTGEKLYILLRGYRVPPVKMLELAERFSLERLSRYVADKQGTYRVEEGPRVRYRGKIAAGRITSSFVDDEATTIGGVPDWVVEKFNLDDVFAVEVNGDSMLSPEAAEAIPDGSTVFLHAKGRPSNGDIICAYLPAHDQTVLKRWVDGSGYAVLKSSNPEHLPIIVSGDEQVLLQGVYITHTPRPRRYR